MRLLVFACLCAVTLCACSTPVWVKPGATQSDFAHDKYGCMQQSQQGASTAFVNQYGGSANSGMITNQNLFSACMNAQGWSLQRRRPDSPQQQANNEQAKAAMDAINAEAQQLCARPDLQAYYNKTPCKPIDATLEQMADKSKITEPEKVAMNKVRIEFRTISNKMNDVIRQYNPQNAATIIARRDQAQASQDQLALDFYEGRITQGEYNKRRAEIAKKLVDDLAGPGQHT